MAAAVPRDEYRGWVISWDYGRYTAVSPDYDASWEGEEDGWVDNGERAEGRTREELCAEIDAWFDERDSGSDPQGENSCSEVECEASQREAMRRRRRLSP